MSKLDVAKEKIAYLKLWLGISLITDISLVGWLLSNGRSASAVMVLGALLAIISITSAAFAVHKRIEKHIDMLEDL